MFEGVIAAVGGQVGGDDPMGVRTPIEDIAERHGVGHDSVKK